MIDQTLGKTIASFKLAGEWDFCRRDELQSMLRPAEAADEVLLDFSEATFIDASVLGALSRLRKRMLERNSLGTIRIVAASRQVKRVFEVCHLEALYGLHMQGDVHEEPETSDEISIGHMYEYGETVARDYATALPWYQMAASTRDTAAVAGVQRAEQLLKLSHELSPEGARRRPAVLRVFV